MYYFQGYNKTNQSIKFQPKLKNSILEQFLGFFPQK